MDALGDPEAERELPMTRLSVVKRGTPQSESPAVRHVTPMPQATLIWPDVALISQTALNVKHQLVALRHTKRRLHDRVAHCVRCVSSLPPENIP